MSHQNVALFGLGSMGIGMARSLVRAGHQVWGYDVRAEIQAGFAEESGHAEPFHEIASKIDTVILVVLNAAQAAEILFGDDGVAKQLAAGALVMNCVTVSPEDARNMAAGCADHHLAYLDAPISGGSIKAGEGALSVMASGSQQAFDKSRLCLDAVAQTVFELGNEAGQGSLMKSVNQILAGIHIAAMAEAMAFGMKQGLDAQAFLDVISKCAGSSWMLENRAPHVIDGDYSPKSAVNIWLKDLGIVLGAAEAISFDAPVTRSALSQYQATAEMGLGGEDDAAVIKLYASQNEISLP